MQEILSPSLTESFLQHVKEPCLHVSVSAAPVCSTGSILKVSRFIPRTSLIGAFSFIMFHRSTSWKRVKHAACSPRRRRAARLCLTVCPCPCRIPPNIRDIVYCTGVSLMDEDVWEFIWMKFHSTSAVSEKKILLEALTCSDNTFLLNRYASDRCACVPLTLNTKHGYERFTSYR